MDLNNKTPTQVAPEAGQYLIITRWLSTKDDKEIEDRDKTEEPVSISTREEFLQLIEKIGTLNREHKYQAQVAGFDCYTEKTLVKL